VYNAHRRRERERNKKKSEKGICICTHTHKRERWREREREREKVLLDSLPKVNHISTKLGNIGRGEDFYVVCMDVFIN